MSASTKKLYLSEGWPNWDYIESLPGNFFFIWGGRGIGKTYGILRKKLADGEMIFYTRRKAKQADYAISEKLQPYAPINRDMQTDIHAYKPKGSDLYGFFHFADGKPDLTKNPVAVLSSMTDIGDIRGIDGMLFKTWVYDEFVPQQRDNKIRGEFDTFLNAYESLNRNRELTGVRALRCYCLSNSDRIDSPIFIGLGLVKYALKLSRAGGGITILPERGITLICMSGSPISAEKSHGALYKAVGEESDYFRMAIKNEFVGENEHFQKSRKLSEYVPLVFVGEIYIYRHKTRDEIYISEHRAGEAKSVYGSGDKSLERFQHSWLGSLWRAYLSDTIIFETRLCELLFCKYCGD